MCNFLLIFPHVFLGAVALVFLGGCKPEVVSPKTDPVQVEAVGRDPLLVIQEAAQQMAWDGFAFARPGHGWPADAGVETGAGYVRLLVERGYLQAIPSIEGKLEVANLSDSDPGETAFLCLKSPSDGTIRILRKDGRCGVFMSGAEAESFASPPEAEPQWLP